MRVPALELPVLGRDVAWSRSLLFFTAGMNFGIDFKGGTLVELQAKAPQADVGSLRERANGLGFGEVEVQEFGAGREVSLRVELQPGGEQGQQAVVQRLRDVFSADYEFRRVEVVGPRVSGELVQSGTLGIMLSLDRDPRLSLVPLRVAVRDRGDDRDAARHRADDRLLRGHADRVQHDLDRRDPDDHRLFAQRHRRGLRPHPRDHAQVQAPRDRRPPRQGDERHPDAHDHHRRVDRAGAAGAHLLRRRGLEELLLRDAVRRSWSAPTRRFSSPRRF